MPIYSMRNIATGEDFEVNIPYSELKDYLESEDNIVQIFNKFPGMADPVRIGITKHDSGFKEVLEKVKSNHKYSTVDVR